MNILDELCSILGVSVEDVASQRKGKKLNEARNVYFYVSKFRSNDFGDIARTIDRKRETAFLGWQKVNDRIKVDKQFKDKVELCKRKILEQAI